MDYLDEIDPLAKQIGAVNTVVHKDGKLIGYNTDGIGFVRAPQSISSKPLQEKRILLLGAGGASRAIYFSLADVGVKEIDVANRTVDKAKELITACRHCPFCCFIARESNRRTRELWILSFRRQQ